MFHQQKKLAGPVTTCALHAMTLVDDCATSLQSG
jgi:hypothetical protein